MKFKSNSSSKGKNLRKFHCCHDRLTCRLRSDLLAFRASNQLPHCTTDLSNVKPPALQFFTLSLWFSWFNWMKEDETLNALMNLKASFKRIIIFRIYRCLFKFMFSIKRGSLDLIPTNIKSYQIEGSQFRSNLKSFWIPVSFFISKMLILKSK